MESYHVRIQGQCVGPYTLDRIRQMTRKGQVGKTHDVSTDGLSWAPATSFPEIFERPAVAASPPATDPIRAPDPGIAHVAPTPTSLPVNPPTEPQWYCSRNGSPHGPMPRAQLLTMIQRGDVATNDFVFMEGTANWVPAGDVPELAAGFPGNSGPRQPGINAFCRECGAGVSQKAVMCPKCGAPTGGGVTPVLDFPDPTFMPPRPPGERKSKTVAAVLALLVGGFGIHHFYLGSPAVGIVYILFCWTLIPALISFVEAIVFLTMSDAAFDEKYNS